MTYSKFKENYTNFIQQFENVKIMSKTDPSMA